jgi:hypothetical protein
MELLKRLPAVYPIRAEYAKHYMERAARVVTEGYAFTTWPAGVYPAIALIGCARLAAAIARSRRLAQEAGQGSLRTLGKGLAARDRSFERSKPVHYGRIEKRRQKTIARTRIAWHRSLVSFVETKRLSVEPMPPVGGRRKPQAHLGTLRGVPAISARQYIDDLRPHREIFPNKVFSSTEGWTPGLFRMEDCGQFAPLRAAPKEEAARRGKKDPGFKG